MNIIGFDFGTTNSMLSYYNPETKELDCFTPNAAASSYIPTVIAYKGDDVIIGTLAKNNITKKGYDAYEHFKLRLGRDADKVIENRSKSPLQVTTDYIKKILAQYQDVQNISHIDGIVMTVPETWFREASNRPQTLKLADTPYLFGEIRQPDTQMLVVLVSHGAPLNVANLSLFYDHPVV